MAAVPIWKDHYTTLGTGDSIRYRIILEDPTAQPIRIPASDLDLEKV